MPAAIIRCEHDPMRKIASDFSKTADDVGKMLQLLKSKYEPLKDGGWIGEGFNAYSREQEGEVFPEFQRLQNALTEASRTTREVSKIMKDKEEEASRVLILVISG